MGSARSDFVPQAGACSGISVSLTARGDLYEWAILVSSPRLPLQFWQLLAIVFFTSTFVLWLGKELSLLSFPFVLYSGLFIMVWVAAPHIIQYFSTAKSNLSLNPSPSLLLEKELCKHCTDFAEAEGGENEGGKDAGGTLWSAATAQREKL